MMHESAVTVPSGSGEAAADPAAIADVTPIAACRITLRFLPGSYRLTFDTEQGPVVVQVRGSVEVELPQNFPLAVVSVA